MRALVAGGSGFIGSHLVTKLLENSFEVRVFDIRKPENPRVEFIEGDISIRKDVERAVKGCEAVFHLASPISVGYTEKHPIETLDTNINGIKNLLDSCLSENVKRMLFSSSSEVYGEPLNVPVHEESPLQPKSCYGVSKLVSEEYIKAYNKAAGLNYAVVRYFNVYGPKQSLGFVIPKFVGLALNQETIPVYGSGKQIRAFCFVDDIVEGTFLAFKSGLCDTFNIGNDKEPIEMRTLAKKIISLTKSNSKMEYVSLDKTDRSEFREIHRRIPDITKARMVLGYEPKVPLDEGIKKIIEWQRREKT